MKYLITILLSTILVSCRTGKDIVVTELNTVGKVIKIKNCKNCMDGKYIYTIEIDPICDGSTIKYVTDTKYKIGDYIYFHTNINLETSEE